MTYKLNPELVSKFKAGDIYVNYQAYADFEPIKALINAAYPDSQRLFTDTGKGFIGRNFPLTDWYSTSIKPSQKVIPITDFILKDSEIVGYKLKNIEHLSAYCLIINKPYDISYWEHIKGGGIAFATGSPAENEMVKHGLLDVLFEPVYKELEKEEIMQPQAGNYEIAITKIDAIALITTDKIPHDKLKEIIEQYGK